MAPRKHARPAATEGVSLSRNESGEYYSNQIRSRRRKRIAWSALGALVITLLLSSVAIAAYVNDINEKITGRVDANLKTVLTTQEAGKPFYMLLIGVDRSEYRAEKYGAADSGYRSDTIILTRIDPAEKKVTLVSIHRDTLVDLGENGQQKINAAFSIGQETYTTQVISEFAGVPISHYAEVDMIGMEAIVDALGGIDVTLDMDVVDPQYMNLDLKKGKHHLDGWTTVKFVRCRHAYDSMGDGDRYRAANQRMVIATIVKKLLASDPATIASTISTLASYVRTDMDVQSIISLAMQFIGMDTEKDFYMGMEPTTPKYINNTWYELCDTTAWRKMMRRVDQGLPPTEEGDADPLESSEGGDEDIQIEDTSSTQDQTYYYDQDEYYYYEEPTYYEEPEPTYYEEPTYVEPMAEDTPAQEEQTYVEPAQTDTGGGDTGGGEAAVVDTGGGGDTGGGEVVTESAPATEEAG